MAKPIFLSPTSKRRLPPNWKKRMEIVNVSKSPRPYRYGSYEHKFVLQFIGTPPKGFARIQGSLTVSKRKPHLVHVANVNHVFRFKGMGRLLYTSAIENLGQLTTDFTDASENAQRLWERLATEYQYKKTRSRLTIFNKQKRSR
jgi:hypothetical protein